MNVFARFEREFTPRRGRRRTAWAAWFAAQWVLVPAEFLLRLLWWPVAAVFGDEWNRQGLAKPLGRVLWPSRLGLLRSRDQDRWERNLAELIACHTGRLLFVPGDQGDDVTASGSRAVADRQRGLLVPPREYGPLTADRIRRAAASYGLRVGLNSRGWLVLRPAAPSAAHPADRITPLERDFVRAEPRNRPGLACWFVAQAVVVPLDLAWRVALYAVLIFGDYGGNGPDLSVSAAWRRWMGPARLAREWSHDQAGWEAHLAGVLAGGPPRSIGRNDYGTLPLDRILAVSAAHRIHGWYHAGGELHR